MVHSVQYKLSVVLGLFSREPSWTLHTPYSFLVVYAFFGKDLLVRWRIRVGITTARKFQSAAVRTNPAFILTPGSLIG